MGVECPPDLATLLGGGRHPWRLKRTIARLVQRYVEETGRLGRRPLNPDALPWYPPGHAAAPAASVPVASNSSDGNDDDDEKRSRASGEI